MVKRKEEDDFHPTMWNTGRILNTTNFSISASLLSVHG